MHTLNTFRLKTVFTQLSTLPLQLLLLSIYRERGSSEVAEVCLHVTHQQQLITV